MYYVDKYGNGDEESFYNYIEIYNVKSNTVKSYIKKEESFWNLACNDNKLFFTCTPNRDLNEEGCVLFYSNLDGTEIKKLVDNVDSFCVYQENIFMVTTGDLGYIHKYNYNNNIFNKIYDGAVSYNFDFSLNRIFCYEYKETRFKSSNILVLNVDTEDKKEYPPYMLNNIAGQYMIFKERDENNRLFLNAYDYLNEKGYKLLDITDIIGEEDRSSIHITADNIYLCTEKLQEFQIYTISIEDGKAGIELITSISS